MSKPMLFGFRDDKFLIRAFSRASGSKSSLIMEDAYPAGELLFRAKRSSGDRAFLVTDVMAEPVFFFRALSVAGLLREAGYKQLTLVAPFIAYGRQDRAVAPGEAPIGKTVGEHLSQGFDRVVTLDAHSPAFMRSFGGKIDSLLPIPPKKSFSFEPTFVAAPDQGATERARAFAAAYKLPSIALRKKRVGRSVRVSLPRRKSFHGARVLLVDDMADSGHTLYEARDLFLSLGAASVGVYVTHLIDNRKRPSGFRKDFSDVVAAYDHKRKRLAPWAFEALAKAVE